MTTNLSDHTNNAASAATDRELVAAARMILQRMGVDPNDLMTDPDERPPVPTFDEYIPKVEDAVSLSTAKTYGSYWNRIRAKWGTRTLLEPIPTEIKQFTEEIKANAIQRRNSRGGRCTAENFIAALRCLYRGMDLKAIQELLGHEWLSTTTRYIHVHDNHVETAWATANERVTARLTTGTE